VGGCAGTGDGDVMMRFSPSFAAVMYMEQGECSVGNVMWDVRIT